MHAGMKHNYYKSINLNFKNSSANFYPILYSYCMIILALSYLLGGVCMLICKYIDDVVIINISNHSIYSCKTLLYITRFYDTTNLDDQLSNSS